MPVERPELLVPDSKSWAAWLAEHHLEHGGVMLVLAKKGTSEPTSLTYVEALDEALCHGWIDGQVRRRDELTYLQRFTPRGPRSSWSQRNTVHVERLAAEGRMRPAGEAAVRAAQADGRWQRAYAGAATIEVPADLARALAENRDALRAFETLDARNRYSVLYRIGEARRPATRARRVAAFVEMLARGDAPHPQAGVSRRAAASRRGRA